jgi:hypothetical protein
LVSFSAFHGVPDLQKHLVGSMPGTQELFIRDIHFQITIYPEGRCKTTLLATILCFAM